MESRLVLVIEGDDDIANQLAVAIREADYEVVVSSTAVGGLAAAIEIRPDCVICDVDLPDDDGHSVARGLRAHPSQVSATPFVLLSAYGDAQARLEGFHVGADVYITKPLRVEEIVAQVDALVQLASRLRRRRDSMMSIPPEAQYSTTAIEGDVRMMSVATVLSVLGMERRTGVFEVVSKKRRSQIEIVAGYVAHGTVGGTRVAPLQALRLMLSWKVGRFSFMPLPPCDPPPSLHTVQGMLLDAARAEDEAAAGVSSRTPYDGQLVTSFGGPPSRPHDTAPPSSRAMREAAGAPLSLAFDLISSRRADHLLAGEKAALQPPPLPGQAAAAAAEPRASQEDRLSVSIDLEEFSMRKEPKLPQDVNLSVSIDLEELSAELSADIEEVLSVRLDELEPASMAAERMLIEETPRVPQVAPSGPGVHAASGSSSHAARAGSRGSFPLASRDDHRATPTPPSGTPLGGLRRRPAIMPPPDSTAERTQPLPAPPAPPRPAPRTLRNTRSAPKKS
jgi:two-component system OmpR family response regulator